MKKIELTKGKFAIVDDEDFEWLNQWKWQYDSHGYATRKLWIIGGKGKTEKIYLHRLIMDNPTNKEVDHINRNKLDCRKSNLRLVTHSQNLLNRPANSNNTSGYKGVFFDKSRNKWKAMIKINYRSIFLGRFNTAKEASNAYLEFGGQI
jgi:hypothetical protein